LKILKRPETFNCDDVLYDLTHTAGFLVETITTHNPLGVKILCTFSCHVFTKKCENDTPNYTVEGENRDFCTTRYNKSVILASLLKSRLYRCGSTQIHTSTDKNNAQRLLMIKYEVGKEDYFIYFEMKKSKKDYADIFLIVRSAYMKSDTPSRDKAKLATEIDRITNTLPRRRLKKRKHR
jgi:hypothetical protein